MLPLKLCVFSVCSILKRVSWQIYTGSHDTARLLYNNIAFLDLTMTTYTVLRITPAPDIAVL